MKSADIREAFLRFFEQNQHTRINSSSLVPGNDPTLLFTNAGMVQFKDVFLGLEQRPYNRATTAQRCVRAGGKHNDLDNVGYTARHHTFFEMLGNFSFGDYFKEDAIRFAWSFLTETLQLPPEKLWVTVHISDDEAEKIWKDKMGIDPTRFSKLDEDNFWQMGDTGPCGPCSEIFYDHGEDVAGDPPGGPNDDGDRYIEIWNLVFMQYQRTADGNMTPLPKPSVDTGAGLERLAAVLQGVHSNYQIDTFQHLLAAAAKAVGCTNDGNASLRVIADHIRSCSFLIADGVLPSNEGRGYVLRRIIRRAVRHGHKLGAEGLFFYSLVPALVEQMGEAYPELAEQQKAVAQALKKEEEQFARTLDQGMRILEEDLAELKGSVIPGEVVFKLYDTFGFPYDLTADIARERNLTLDEAGYEKAMEQQKQRARSASQFGVDYTASIKLDSSVDANTQFQGYESLSESATVVGLFVEGKAVGSVKENDEVVVVLNNTPFYAESGGQAGDVGLLESATGIIEIQDTSKNGNTFLHHGIVTEGTFSNNTNITATVDETLRQKTALNHSATHLLHAALRQVLGTHVEQKGSLVDSSKLRFDFSNPEAVSKEDLRTIEQLVNEQIRLNSKVQTEVTDMDSAIKKGAMALFGEKYTEEVRVLTMGEGFSVELCGGTHATRTGDIGLLRITSESGVASGVRRIEAITGEAALNWCEQSDEQLGRVAALVKGSRDNVIEKIEGLLAGNRQLEKEIERLKQKLATGAGTDLTAQAVEIDGIKVLAAVVDGADNKTLRVTMDQLKDKMGSAVLLLAAVEGDKITLVAGVTKNLTDKIQAGKLMQTMAPQLGGKGGGKPDMAQGGGSDIAALAGVLQSVPEWVKTQLK